MSLYVSGPRPRFARPLVTVFVLALVASVMTVSPVLAAPPKISLEQCRNGSATTPNDCEDLGGSSGWVNGNVGAQQGHLVEGYSIPYRALIQNAPTGSSITVDIGYDIKHSGAHAIDFLTHYERLGGASHDGSFGHESEEVLPTDGTTVAALPVSEWPIPAPTVLKDGQPLARFGQLPAAERFMSLFGGTISNVQYLAEGDLNAAQSEARVRVTFTLASPNAVLAWGGHIARGPDWDGQSASEIDGSPYHMRLKAWSAGNVGNQDRSLSAGAVLAIQPGLSTALTEVGSALNTGPMISVTVGASVIDSATLIGATPDAGGTISYAVFSDSTCTTLVEDLTPSPNTVVNGAIPDSDAFATTSVGTFYFQAEYGGDGLNLPATSVCTDEVLTVTKASPTATTQVKRSSNHANVNDGDTVTIGTSVYDTASLTGAFSAGGTAEYFYKKQATATLDCANGISLGTKAVTNGIVANSDAVTLTEAGTYEFWVVYAGDANNNPATSVCGSETVIVGKNSPTATTLQSLLPNDSLTLSGATSGAGGTVDFYLFAPGVSCGVANVANAAYSALDRPLVGNTTASTNNTAFVATTEGTWRWLAIYEGDANNNPFTSNCVEAFTIDNDTSS